MTDNKPLSTIPTPIYILQNSGPINCLLFSVFNNQLIYAGNRNGGLNIYDLNLRRSIFNQNTSNQSILSIVELNENSILTHARNGIIYKWSKNQSEWNCKSIYEKEIYTFCQFSLNNERNILFIPSNEASVIDCIELASNKKINSLRPKFNSKDRGLLMNIKFIDSNYLFGGYENGELALFDLRTYAEVSSINLFHGQPLMCYDYSSEANFGLAGSTEKSMKQVSLNEEKTNFYENNTLDLTNPGLNCIKIRNSDSKIFSCGGWDSRVRVYGRKKLKLLAVLDFHKEAINTIDFSSNNIMAVGSSDCMISFWNLY